MFNQFVRAKNLPQFRIGYDALVLLVAKSALIGLRLITIYSCAAFLNPIEFGPLALAFTITEIVRFVIDWGGDTLSLRRFSEPDEASATKTLAEYCAYRFWILPISYILAVTSVSVGSGLEDTKSILLVSATVPTSIIANICINWLQARGRLSAALVAIASLGTGGIIAQLVASQFSLSVTSRLSALIAIELLLCFSLVLFLPLSSLKLRFQRRNFAGWVFAGSEIALAAILSMTYSKFDQLYIKFIGEYSTLGEYSLALRVVEPFLFVASALSTTIYTRTSTMLASGMAKVELFQKAKSWILVTFAYALMVAIVLMTANRYLAPLYFSKYIHFEMYLWICLLALAIRCANLCLTSVIQSTGNYRYMLYINGGNFIICGLLVYLLGMTFGSLGAIVALVIGDGINGIVQFIVINKISSS